MQGAIIDLLNVVGEFSLVGSARTEAEANLWVADNPGKWDLAILDLVLDQGSGLSVIQQCKRISPAAKIVVFSHYVTDGIRHHCLGLGADAAISKADFKSLTEYCLTLSPGDA